MGLGIFKGLGKIAKTAGKWAMNHPDTIITAAEKGYEMKQNAKANKQTNSSQSEMPNASKDTTLIEAKINDVVKELSAIQAKVSAIDKKLNDSKCETQNKIMELQSETQNIRKALNDFIVLQNKRFIAQTVALTLGVIVAVVLSIIL